MCLLVGDIIMALSLRHLEALWPRGRVRLSGELRPSVRDGLIGALQPREG